jgi:hypothetical protein
MSPCLSDRSLFLLAEGDDDARARVHLATCVRCRARYDGFGRATNLAAAALRSGPLPEARVRRRPALLPAAATLTALVLGVAIGVVGRHRDARAPGQGIGEPSVLADVYRDVFVVDAGEQATLGRDDLYLQAALRGEWPCEQQGSPLDPRCE